MLETSTLSSSALVAPERRGFYQRPTREVARDLVGALLMRPSPEGLIVLRIVEVEAYLGAKDKACHTVGGRHTPRVRSMWGPAGHAYVYLSHGIHSCLNVVTRGEAGEAVLLRAAVIVAGEAVVELRRSRRVRGEIDLDGPGKLGQALGVADLDGVDLCSGKILWIQRDSFKPSIVTSARIGVEGAGEAAAWGLRFHCRSRFGWPEHSRAPALFIPPPR